LEYVGVDTTVLKRGASRSLEISSEREGPGFFQALLGVSITTQDRQRFKGKYDAALADVFEINGVKRRKKCYKAAHLVKQAGEKAPKIIQETLMKLDELISRIDVYVAYYGQEFISIHGMARGERLEPIAFIGFRMPFHMYALGSILRECSVLRVGPSSSIILREDRLLRGEISVSLQVQ